MLPIPTTSEYEPLINNNNAKNSNSSTNNNKRTSYSIKTFIAFLVVLIATAIIIYFIFPRNDLFSSSSTSSISDTKWVRMESAHEHAQKVPKSWSVKQECDENHQFTLTLALKQQNTDCMYYVFCISFIHPYSSNHSSPFYNFFSLF